MTKKKLDDGALVFAAVPETTQLKAPWVPTGMVSTKSGSPRRYRVWVKPAQEDGSVAVMSGICLVDELGRVRARKAELEKEEKCLKEGLHELGAGAYEGRLFRATVCEDYEQDVYDNEAIREKLIALGHRRFVNAHRRREPREGSVRVYAKSGKKVARSA